MEHDHGDEAARERQPVDESESGTVIIDIMNRTFIAVANRRLKMIAWSRSRPESRT